MSNLAGQPSAVNVDTTAVRQHLEIMHAQAALCTGSQPGLMTLLRVHPDAASVVPQRFQIGDVETMARVAIDDAAAAHNVYVEARTVRPGLSPKARGDLADTVSVFALVRDNDADKGKGGKLDFSASLVVGSSPGNSHDYVFLPPDISPSEACDIGRGMKAACGGDNATGLITQPFRVAGTPNYPSASKRARGRVATPTGIIRCNGQVWTREQLLAVFPPPPPPQKDSEIPTGRTGIADAGVEEIIAEQSKKRGEQLFHGVKAARAAGMTPGDLEDLMRRHPDGCASKFLKPYDRLRKEIERAWRKLGRHPATEPTYIESTADAISARALTRQHIENFLEVCLAA